MEKKRKENSEEDWKETQESEEEYRMLESTDSKSEKELGVSL